MSDDPIRPPAPLAESDALFIEDVEARQNKGRREVQYHTLQIPRLRLLGMAMLGVVAAAHGELLLGGALRTRTFWFVAASLGYALVSWWVLLRWFARCLEKGVNLGTFFLAFDILWFAAAVWVSGADQSWLVVLLLVRVADQTNTTFRRVLVFLHLSVASYLLVLLAQHLLDGRPPRLRVEAVKLLIVYFTGLYIATTARTAEALRRRTTRAIHVGRGLIQTLRTQSEALEKARADAERAGRAKTVFLGNMGHELRTPLTAVLGLTELVLETELSAEQREHLGAVRGSGAQLLRMVDDILDLARLEAGALTLRDEPVDLRRLLDDLAAELRAGAADKGLVVTAAVAPDVPLQVRGDGGRLAQALGHLGRNAVKFTDAGSVALAARVTGGDLELSVSDTGIGIAGDKQAMIFDAFSQVEGSTQRKHGGTGLGLALVGRLARLMNGRVGLESEPGHGARFVLALPLVVEAVAPAGAARDRRSPARG